MELTKEITKKSFTKDINPEKLHSYVYKNNR